MEWLAVHQDPTTSVFTFEMDDPEGEQYSMDRTEFFAFLFGRVRCRRPQEIIDILDSFRPVFVDAATGEHMVLHAPRDVEYENWLDLTTVYSRRYGQKERKRVFEAGKAFVHKILDTVRVQRKQERPGAARVLSKSPVISTVRSRWYK